ncbi:hypothetical protein ACEZCY_14240 [Streptacidiphilus sp. N1-12]|uniref:Uncharacterized protein n=2 Tax=Streptacidiphilus alkalitolerans TaxID=3342712 RepID=A0ABV6WEH8_9ACTN
MATVCVGEEFVVDNDGRLRINVANGSTHEPVVQSWLYSAADPTASTNAIRFDPVLGLWVDPPSHATTVSALGTTTAGAGAVPSVASSIASPAVVASNPSATRWAEVVQLLAVDVYWSLPAGASASINCICEGDEWLRAVNPAPAAGTAMSGCHSEYQKIIVGISLAPGETRTITRDLSIKGGGGATWSQATWNNKLLIVTQ